eukprot:TRINITY_DN524_c0_g1_i2.p1 TRINITY_DN524_c0_g1~~TRINITY_DN524_c0_g1_i2.p1  ORF type:complete len:144 (-),score=27.48 TRINITY_DN524_c0_g1_i2:955-1386(-)
MASDPPVESPALRSRMGVNSPRRPSKQMDFSEDSANDEESQQESVHLETRQDYSDDADEEVKNGDHDEQYEPPANLITQVAKEENRKEDEEDSPSGWSRLCSCLFSSKPKRPAVTPSPRPPIDPQGGRISHSSDGDIDVGRDF